MGNERVTSSNIRVALVDPERNLIGVQGSVPRRKGWHRHDQGGSQAVGLW